MREMLYIKIIDVDIFVISFERKEKNNRGGRFNHKRIFNGNV